MRPFLLWLAVAVVVVGYYEHRRRSAWTRLNFTVTVDGEPADLRELEMTLDGRTFFDFLPVRIGTRTLRVTGPGLVRTLSRSGSGTA